MPEAATTKFTPAYYKDLAGKLRDHAREAKTIIPSLLEYGDWDGKKAKLDAQLAEMRAEIESLHEQVSQVQGMINSKKHEHARLEDEGRVVQNDLERKRKEYFELELSIRKMKRDNRLD